MSVLSFSKTLAAAPPIVYAAFTQPALLNLWLNNDSHINPVTGGHYFLSWTHGYYAAGVFRELEQNRRLVLTWQGQNEPGPTTVTVTLEPAGEGTSLTLAHSDLGTGDAWEATARQIEQGWREGLADLQALLETGLDARLYRRPMLGVYTGAADDATRERLNIPLPEAMILSGVLPEGSAARAGLQVEDALVTMNGQDITTPARFGAVISGLTAGQTIPVEYYRGGTRHTVQLTLGSRPYPEIPATVEALVAKAREANTTAVSELRDLLREVPEALLAQSPAPGDWSVREVLAHLVMNERLTHFHLWGIHSGDNALPYPGNDALHLAPALAACPTAADLLDALERDFRGTEGLFAAIAPDFVRHKALFAYMAQLADVALNHIRTHHAQITAAIEAAKAGAGQPSGAAVTA